MLSELWFNTLWFQVLNQQLPSRIYHSKFSSKHALFRIIFKIYSAITLYHYKGHSFKFISKPLKSKLYIKKK